MRPSMRNAKLTSFWARICPVRETESSPARRSGTVNLIGSGRDKAGEAGHTNAYAQAATPVTSAQVWKAWVRAARY